MILIRKMTVDDVPLGMRLKDQAGWNQTESDWRRILALQPDGCFVAELDDRPVGTTCTCVLGSIGWLAMVLVEESVRSRGIGTRLVQHAVEYFDRAGVRTMRLDATPLGRPVYEKLGFLAEYELARWTGTAGGGQLAADVCPARPEHLEAICTLDREGTGTDRRRLLARLYDESPAAVQIVMSEGQIAGYSMLRRGSRAVQIGPVVASDAAAGRALCDAALQRCAGQPVVLDTPAENLPAMEWAQSHGLKIERPLTRMRRGEPVYDRPTQLWASFGPEKG
jgi:GNAT superfamily N-acetyltransferase